MNYFTVYSPFKNSAISSWGRKNRKQSLNILRSHQNTLTPVLSLLWALPVWMEKQQHSLNYGMYQCWRFCTALYFSKALSTEFPDTLAQVLQHEAVEQNLSMPQLCHMFCLWNQKQIFQEVSQKHQLLKTYVTDQKALSSLWLTLCLLDWLVCIRPMKLLKMGMCLRRRQNLPQGQAEVHEGFRHAGNSGTVTFKFFWS